MKIEDGGTGHQYTYDAWNRLVEVNDADATVETYEYDGLNRRIIRDDQTTVFHYYHNHGTQVLEVRKEVSGSEVTTPLEQYVYHPYYVDAVVVRFYDSGVDGNPDAHYYTHDANFNVTAVIDDSGTVLERYHYTPYGAVKYLDSDFVALDPQASTIANRVLYTGRRLDIATGLYFYNARL